MVRALTSHQCGLGSTPDVVSICGLSLFLVLSPAPRGFSLGIPVFPPPQKPTFQIPILPGTRYTKNHMVDVVPPNLYLFTFYLFIYFTYEYIGLLTLSIQLIFTVKDR